MGILGTFTYIIRYKLVRKYTPSLCSTPLKLPQQKPKWNSENEIAHNFWVGKRIKEKLNFDFYSNVHVGTYICIVTKIALAAFTNNPRYFNFTMKLLNIKREKFSAFLHGTHAKDPNMSLKIWWSNHTAVESIARELSYYVYGFKPCSSFSWATLFSNLYFNSPNRGDCYRARTRRIPNKSFCGCILFSATR